MLDTLASNRDLNLNIREELDMLTIDVEKLVTYQMGLEKGLQKGIEQGVEQGLEQGLEQGKEEGAHERNVAIARKLLDMGLNISQVVAATGLPQEDVEVLREGKPN